MKANNFFEMTNEELTNKVAELKAELMDLRFKHSTNQLSNPMSLAACKKDIARAKTVLRLRELGRVDEPEKSAKKTRSRQKKA